MEALPLSVFYYYINIFLEIILKIEIIDITSISEWLVDNKRFNHKLKQQKRLQK